MTVIFSIISIIFYFIICKGLVYIDCDSERKPFKLLHFLLLSLIACIPLINIIAFIIILGVLTILILNDCIGIKNSDNKIIRFLNKEL